MRRCSPIAVAALTLTVVGCTQAAFGPSQTPGVTPSPSVSASPTDPSAPLVATPSSPSPSTSLASTTPRASRGVWEAAASMNRERSGFDAVLLGDGTVLAVGNDRDCTPGGAIEGSDTAEVYDPSADVWFDVEPLNKLRKIPATLNLLDGSAVVLGGINADDFPFSSTKVFSPSTRRWSDGPLLGRAHGRPHAIRLDDGRIVVMSGDARPESSEPIEIADAALESWSVGGSVPATLSVIDVIALRGGRALVIAFSDVDVDGGPEAFIYDVDAGTWTSSTGGIRLAATVVALPDGGALAIGGVGGGELWGDMRPVIPDVDRLDPETGRWTPVAPMSTPRYGLQVAVLVDGRVLVAGGTATDGSRELALPSAEVYEPATDTWTPTGDLVEARYSGMIVPFADGSALILGGSAEYNVEGDVPFCPAPMISVERYRP